MSVGIYSREWVGTNPEIAYYQKKVFEKFGIDINQVSTGHDHGNSLNMLIDSAEEDVIIIFDLDCVPLNNKFYDILVNQVKGGDVLSGAAGCCNHIDPTRFYVHTGFFGFTKQLYLDCQSPNMNEYETGDIGQKFTDECLNIKKKTYYWNVTSSEDELWKLPDGTFFGHGTIYENMIYHQFEIRNNEQHAGFIAKCKEILNDMS